jgi:hypothetical protein
MEEEEDINIYIFMYSLHAGLLKMEDLPLSKTYGIFNLWFLCGLVMTL